jgi:hypothetical protein
MTIKSNPFLQINPFFNFKYIGGIKCATNIVHYLKKISVPNTNKIPFIVTKDNGNIVVYTNPMSKGN